MVTNRADINYSAVYRYYYEQPYTPGVFMLVTGSIKISVYNKEIQQTIKNDVLECS